MTISYTVNYNDNDEVVYFVFCETAKLDANTFEPFVPDLGFDFGQFSEAVYYTDCPQYIIPDLEADPNYVQDFRLDSIYINEVLEGDTEYLEEWNYWYFTDTIYFGIVTELDMEYVRFAASPNNKVFPDFSLASILAARNFGIEMVEITENHFVVKAVDVIEELEKTGVFKYSEKLNG